MNFPRRQLLKLAVGATALPAFTQLLKAENYPTRPIRLVIGYTPGGSADLTARLMGQWLSDRLGQTFVVENRPGGGHQHSDRGCRTCAARWLLGPSCRAGKRHQRIAV